MRKVNFLGGKSCKLIRVSKVILVGNQVETSFCYERTIIFLEVLQNETVKFNDLCV